MLLSQVKKTASALLIVSVMLGCSKNGDPSTEKTNLNENDRKALLANVADNIVLPAYADFKVKFDLMKAKADAFNQNPSSNSLREFRNSWVTAYTEWQKIELFDFGPAQVYAMRLYFNTYPTSESSINLNIASSTANLEVPAAYPAQGFPAIDYLINGLGNTDDEILSFYTTATDAAKRLAYLKRLTDRMNSIFTTVNSEWNGEYRTTFKNKTAIDAGSSTSLMINSYVLNYERYIRSGKFGIPSGIMAGGTLYPDKVEAYYKKDISLILAKAAHQASLDFFNGKHARSAETGYSIKNYLNALDAKDSSTGKLLSELINEQFAVTTQKINLLSSDLSNEVRNNNQAMINVFNEMQKSVKLLKVDMTSAMSITITYTDNDGD